MAVVHDDSSLPQQQQQVAVTVPPGGAGTLVNVPVNGTVIVVQIPPDAEDGSTIMALVPVGDASAPTATAGVTRNTDNAMKRAMGEIKGISRKRFACSCCCGLGCYFALVPFFWIVSFFVIFGGDFTAAGPGDLIRRELQDDIVSALQSGSWSKVQSGFESIDAAANSALLIGDARGDQWELARGWINLDDEYAIASESKMIASLTVYRVMQHSNLTLDSSPAEFFESWEGSEDLTLEHLLAFTSGFTGSDDGSCAFNGGGETGWAKCVDELAALDRGVPGAAFNYGSWHLVVACAMAQRALDRPLSSAAWERTVKEELGLEAVNYDGIASDIPESMPFFGQWYWDTREAFPGFAHGMRMSGRQYAKVLKSLQFEGLLDGTNFGGSTETYSLYGLAAFVLDRTAEVEWQGDLGGNAGLDIGTWHYAQGAWLACDAASEAANSEGKLGSSDGVAASELCGAVPTPHVVHSFGLWGAYFWMDLTNDYYGIFVHSSAIDMRNMYWIGVTLSVFVSLLVVGLWYRVVIPKCACCGCCA